MGSRKKYDYKQNLYMTLYRKLQKIISIFSSFNCFAVFVAQKGVVNGQNINGVFLLMAIMFLLFSCSIKRSQLTFSYVGFEGILCTVTSFCIAYFLKFHAMYAIYAFEVVLFLVILYNDDYMKPIIKKYRCKSK